VTDHIIILAAYEDQAFAGDVSEKLNNGFQGSISHVVASSAPQGAKLAVICSEATCYAPELSDQITRFLGQNTISDTLCIVLSGPTDPMDAKCVIPGMLNAHVLASGFQELRETPVKIVDLRTSSGPVVAAAEALRQAWVEDEPVKPGERVRTRNGWIATPTRMALTGFVAGGALMFALPWSSHQPSESISESDSNIAGLVRTLTETLPSSVNAEVLSDLDRSVSNWLATSETLDAFERASLLRLVGETRFNAGDISGAETAFGQAYAITQQAADNADGNTLFEHAQSVFWLGNAAYRVNDVAGATEFFEEYAALASRMIQLEPDNAAFKTEYFAAKTNVAMLLLEGNAAAAAETKLQQIISDATDESLTQTAEFAEFHAWLADAQLAQGKLEEAFNTRQKLADLYRALTANAAATELHQWRVASNDAIRAEIALQRGDVRKASALLEAAELRTRNLLDANLDSERYRALFGKITYFRAELLMVSEDTLRAFSVLDASERFLGDTRLEKGHQQNIATAWIHLARAQIFLHQENYARASAVAGVAKRELQQFALPNPQLSLAAAEAALIEALALEALGEDTAATDILVRAASQLESAQQQDARARDIQLRIAAARGEDISKDMLSAALPTDYRPPDFDAFWNARVGNVQSAQLKEATNE
jgi:hypothetical protein